MASNHTEHFGLSQWNLSDSVVMADFNEDNRKIDEALAAGMKIQSGTYTGTGEFGAEHPNTLTFDFEPKLVFVREANINRTSPLAHFCWFPGTNSDTLDKSAPVTMLKYTSEGTTLHWHASGTYASEWWQLNGAGVTYYYVAMG